MFGQVAHPAAHELIHKPGRALRLLGRLIYASLLVGHHASAHLRVHHVHVGSDADPNSAQRGEGFYRYALRASRQSFRAGLAAESRLRAHADKPAWTHPYALYMTVAAATFLLAAGLAGWGGIAALLGIAAYAQLQILMSDYVQHYGLRRHVMADGRLEPVGPQHSWNAPHWFSSALMLNAPRHSDHHVTPSRPFPALQLDPERMPYLPHPVPLMATIALVPPLWRRVMDPLCDRWAAPAWAPRPATARDIPPAVLARAKSGGTGAPGLPQSGHA
jgi:alkane 1-monooxygenase